MAVSKVCRLMLAVCWLAVILLRTSWICGSLVNSCQTAVMEVCGDDVGNSLSAQTGNNNMEGSIVSRSTLFSVLSYHISRGLLSRQGAEVSGGKIKWGFHHSIHNLFVLFWKSRTEWWIMQWYHGGSAISGHGHNIFHADTSLCFYS